MIIPPSYFSIFIIVLQLIQGVFFSHFLDLFFQAPLPKLSRMPIWPSAFSARYFLVR